MSHNACCSLVAKNTTQLDRAREEQLIGIFPAGVGRVVTCLDTNPLAFV